MKSFFLTFALAVPTMAMADMDAVIDRHILPGYAALAAQTQSLAIATETCEQAPAQAAYHNAFDAWMAIGHIQFGPIEAQSATLKIAYWPDPKGQTAKTLGRLIRAEDQAVHDATAYSEVSIAGQGLFALEHMLFEAVPSDYGCALIKAIAGELAQNTTALNAAWVDGHADALHAATPPYNSKPEVLRVVYTALSTGLEFIEAKRLGRPLGTFERSRAKRAEAHRSERSVRNITLSLQALQALATTFADHEIPKTQTAFAEAIMRAKALDDPALQGVADPAKRFKVEVLQQKVAAIRVAIDEEIGATFGVRAGFNSLDGD